MIKKICYLAFISFFLVINVAQANSNIVYVDIDFLIKNSNIGKASLDKLETINKKNIKKLTDREIELKKNESFFPTFCITFKYFSIYINKLLKYITKTLKKTYKILHKS